MKSIKIECSRCNTELNINIEDNICPSCLQEVSIYCNGYDCEPAEYMCQECEEAENEGQYQMVYEEFKERGFEE
jgi:hypothetical protein